MRGPLRPLALLSYVLLVGLPWLAPLPAGAEDAEAPLDATQVIVRGKTKLVDALQAALHPAWAEGAPETVALLLDVTPHTAKAGDRIVEALAGLADRTGPAWQVGRLGGRLDRPVESATELAEGVREALGKETPVVSTIEALRKTLKGLKGERAAVVYLADWHFEDDCDLERFIKDLRGDGTTFSVVGTEAAFGRAWNDGIKGFADYDLHSTQGIDLEDYFDSIGRDPFGRGKHKAPWHGGDTAYPHMPYRFAWTAWDTTFSASDWDLAGLGDSEDLEDLFEKLDGAEPPDPEELAKRLEELEKKRGGEGLPPELPAPAPAPAAPAAEDRHIEYPLPSSFGPYGLMRAAGATGGRYVLFSWNPGGRRGVQLDYGRCNLLPPDLRARKAIRTTLGENPWARAMVRAWNVLAEADAELVEIGAPLDKRLRPQRIDKLAGSGDFTHVWHQRSEHKRFLRRVPDLLELLTEARGLLDEALATPEPSEPTLRRHAADAAYLRHALGCIHLQLAEGLRVAKALPRDAFDDRHRHPGIVDRTWVRQGRDPERMRFREEARPQDGEAADALAAERKLLLARLKGTPLGEQLALNTIDGAELTWFQETTEIPDMGRSPTESHDRPKPRTPGGGSGPGGGPTTGK